MNVLLADHQVDARDRKHDDKEQYRRRGCIGRESAAVTVEHIVNVADDGIHLRGIKIDAEERDRIAVRLERADKARDYEVKERGRDHRKRDLREHTPLCCAVNEGGVIIILIDRGKRARQNQNLEGHNDPNGVEAEDQHLCPIRSVNKIHRLTAEEVDQHVHHTVRVRRFLEEDHKNETDREGVGNVRQKIDGLEELAERLDRCKRNRNKKRESR